MFLIWLGEQITERGVGNGISIIIFAGIVAGLPSAIGGTIELAVNGEIQNFSVILIFLLAIVITAFVVYVETRTKKIIPINYARKMQGRKMYAAQSSFLPLKLNMAGVIPPILRQQSYFSLTIASWSGSRAPDSIVQKIAMTLSPGQPLILCFMHLLLFSFCFFLYCFGF